MPKAVKLPSGAYISESDRDWLLSLKDAETVLLRAGVQRIADGYGGDVASFARNLLEGKV